jgi:hypothetical protein
MREELKDFLWEPRKKWVGAILGFIALVAWLTMLLGAVIGRLSAPVVVTSLLILGGLGLLQMLMSVRTKRMHGYIDTEEEG